jgi:hypothetical protein
MQCPHCDQDHPEGSQFCPTTGKTILDPGACPECGNPVDPNWLHCGYCGRKLTPTEAKPIQQEAANVPQTPKPAPKIPMTATGSAKIRWPIILGCLGGLLILAMIVLSVIWFSQKYGFPAAIADIVQTTTIAPTKAIASETLLGNYQENGNGGFSSHWLAYIVEPQEGATDQSSFVELNGQRLGPYSNLSRRFEISPNGEHIAFAAEKNAKWVIVVDGQEMWEHESVGYTYYAWGPDLEGKAFIPQTNAAILEFSPSGDQLAYMVKVNDAEWAIYINGKPGQTYQSVSTNIQFVEEKLAYWAEGSTGKVYIYGDSILGPYEEIWKTAFSSDRKHFVFAVKKQDAYLLVVDGKEQDLSGEIDNYEMGPAGELAYSTKSGAGMKVNFGSQELPDVYDEISQLTISPDGKHLAFWARQGFSWSVVTDTRNFPGFDGYYFYESSGEIYSILWDKESANLAYFARNGKDVILALNGEQHPVPGFPGIAISVIVDDQRNIVGESRMGMPNLDRQAYVECLLQSDSLMCDPLSVTLIRDELAYIETGEKESFMVIGTKKEGPYASIDSVLLRSSDNMHYAYIVTNGKGQQTVLDGTLMDWAYEAVYRAQFIGDTGFGHLGKRGNEIYGVFYPYR